MASPTERQAMARALERAADRFEEHAQRIDASLAGHRKAHHGDQRKGETAAVLRTVVSRLRAWAARCISD